MTRRTLWASHPAPFCVAEGIALVWVLVVRKFECLMCVLICSLSWHCTWQACFNIQSSIISRGLDGTESDHRKSLNFFQSI
ncbi:hypothetical protein H4582DRAFT_759655 [Lactarius indigo]|nr:hypothetical protein H4582DRAFT_759655 [Lactarius indigo]